MSQKPYKKRNLTPSKIIVLAGVVFCLTVNSILIFGSNFGGNPASASGTDLMITEVNVPKADNFGGNGSCSKKFPKSKNINNCNSAKWFELYNPTENSIDVSKYFLRQSNSTKDYKISENSLLIKPLKFFVFGIGGNNVTDVYDSKVSFISDNFSLTKNNIVIDSFGKDNNTGPSDFYSFQRCLGSNEWIQSRNEVYAQKFGIAWRGTPGRDCLEQPNSTTAIPSLASDSTPKVETKAEVAEKIVENVEAKAVESVLSEEKMKNVEIMPENVAPVDILTATNSLTSPQENKTTNETFETLDTAVQQTQTKNEAETTLDIQEVILESKPVLQPNVEQVSELAFETTSPANNATKPALDAPLVPNQIQNSEQNINSGEVITIQVKSQSLVQPNVQNNAITEVFEQVFGEALIEKSNTNSVSSSELLGTDLEYLQSKSLSLEFKDALDKFDYNNATIQEVLATQDNSNYVYDGRVSENGFLQIQLKFITFVLPVLVILALVMVIFSNLTQITPWIPKPQNNWLNGENRW